MVLCRRMALPVRTRTLWFVMIDLPSVSSRCIVGTSARTFWTAFERGNCGADPARAVSSQSPAKRFITILGAYLLYSARRIIHWYGPAPSPVVRRGMPLTIDDWSAFIVYQNTRMTRAEFKLAMHYLQIPVQFHTSNRLAVSGEEAFIITLTRLTYPNRLAQLEELFSRDHTEVSRIAQEFACAFMIINEHCEDLRHLLTEARLRQFNEAIRIKQAERAATLGIVIDATFDAREGQTALYVDGVPQFLARPTVRRFFIQQIVDISIKRVLPLGRRCTDSSLPR
jgi:hypothetical protein